MLIDKNLLSLSRDILTEIHQEAIKTLPSFDASNSFSQGPMAVVEALHGEKKLGTLAALREFFKAHDVGLLCLEHRRTFQLIAAISQQRKREIEREKCISPSFSFLLDLCPLSSTLSHE